MNLFPFILNTDNNLWHYALWHRRLSHIIQGKMKRLMNEGILPSLLESSHSYSKRKGSIDISNPLEIIRSDTCGPFPTATVMVWDILFPSLWLFQVCFWFLIAVKSRYMMFSRSIKKNVRYQLEKENSQIWS